MKPFVLWKMPILFCGLGAALILAPACKAQSEINPDHFDGTDSWDSARQASTSKATAKPATPMAQAPKADSGAKVQLAAVRDLSKPAPQDAVAVQDKRKAAVRKSKKQ
jgi:hypothetical protein